MEQLRIIKEMRRNDADNGRTGIYTRPRYMVWENVPGAFSSNKGNDFATVLEETVKVACEKTPHTIPKPKHGWTNAGCLSDVGGKWSIAWRVFNARFWGVPQKRKRIALVTDFGGLTAPEILFEREGVFGDIEQSRPTRESDPAEAEGGVGKAIGAFCFQSHGVDAFVLENHPQDSRIKISEDGVFQTLASNMGMGGNNVPLVMLPIAYDCRNHTANVISATIQAKGNSLNYINPVFVINNTQSTVGVNAGYSVRRLTPLECERLQGYPDYWTDIGAWVDGNGKNRPESTDSARYKAIGNSIALPPWEYVLQRLSICCGGDVTMASLFDGIGGFPLIWERLNGAGTCLWASEIEDFPIAVTMRHFREEAHNEYY